jgi:hypothetical protein
LRSLPIGHQLVLLWPGFVAGLAAAATLLLLQAERGTVIFPEIATDASSSVLQPSGFSFLLQNLGSDGKPLFFFSIVILQIIIYTAIALVVIHFVARYYDRLISEPWPRSGTALAFTLNALGATAIFLLITALLVWFSAAEIPARTNWFNYTLGALTASTVFAAIALLPRLAIQPRAALNTAQQITPVPLPVEPPVQTTATTTTNPSPETPIDAPIDFTSVSNPPPLPEPNVSRRNFLHSAGGLAIGAVSTVIIGRQVLGRRGGGAQISATGLPTPPITSNANFYRVSKNLFDPRVDGDGWHLTVNGSVDNPFVIELDEILAMPSREVTVTLQCISNEVGGDLISNARWTGFPLSDLLNRAGISSTAQFVGFRSADDYTESLPLDFALQEQIMLVHTMNGLPLPDGHGFPLRLLSPGKYGIKHPKWITQIALLDQEILGFWQQRGWTQEARMKTSSRIDVPSPGQTVELGTTRIHGVSFSGDRGIDCLEVSIDRGQTWHDAVLTPPLSPFTWILWHYDTDVVTDNDRFNVLARATDGDGEVQTVTPAPPDPDGASGWPAVSVRAREPRPPSNTATG